MRKEDEEKIVREVTKALLPKYDRLQHYILDEERNIIPVDLMTWAKWLDRPGNKRTIDRTKKGKLVVSTVFIGLDHGYREEDEPLIFESMFFDDGSEKDCVRTSTVEEAQEAHKKMCEDRLG